MLPLGNKINPCPLCGELPILENGRSDGEGMDYWFEHPVNDCPGSNRWFPHFSLDLLDAAINDWNNCAFEPEPEPEPAPSRDEAVITRLLRAIKNAENDDADLNFNVETGDECKLIFTARTNEDDDIEYKLAKYAVISYIHLNGTEHGEDEIASLPLYFGVYMKVVAPDWLKENSCRIDWISASDLKPRSAVLD